VSLAASFYEALAAGLPIDAALAQARQSLATGGWDLDVGLPVVFLHGADTRLMHTGGDIGGAGDGRSAAERRAAAANNVGIALWRRGEEDGAIAAYRLAADLGSGPGANNLGIRLKRRGDLDGAITAYRRGVALDHPAAHNNLALLIEPKAPKRALELFEAAVKLGSPKAAANLGKRRKRLGDIAGAREAYRDGCALGHAASCNNLALLVEGDDPDEAMRVFERGAVLGSATAANNLGRRLRDRDGPGDRERAAQALRRAVELGHPKAGATLKRLLEAGGP
jgi:TPR repeat protein